MKKHRIHFSRAFVLLYALLLGKTNAQEADNGLSPAFMIKLVGSDFCLQPSRNSSLIQHLIIDHCDDRLQEQLWRSDDSGRLHSVLDDKRCIQKINDTQLLLGECILRNPSTNLSNQFLFGQNTGAIKWKRNESIAFSIFPDKIIKGGIVHLALLPDETRFKEGQEWELKPYLIRSNDDEKEDLYTYAPGDLRVRENGLLLSVGLVSRIVAKSGQGVPYAGGGVSKDTFHQQPDAAAVFGVSTGENKGGWLYVSNSEVRKGGVGMITFDKNGDAIKYEMIMKGTRRNCGGGRTPWNTWVSCEEFQNEGQVYEVDPYIGITSQQMTVLGGTGGTYESFAYDARNSDNLTFYVTNDSQNGALLRFTPDPLVLAKAKTTGYYGSLLLSKGKMEWLILEPKTYDSSATSGTFRWTTSRGEGGHNANRYYAFSEGIDIRDGFLFFTCKKMTSLFILNLDDFTYTRSSTKSGKFEGQPDTIVRIIDKNDLGDMLYFCEDGQKQCGIHAKDRNNKYYTILEGAAQYAGDETTGLAFSPDNKRLYVCFQKSGTLYEISRKDGHPFGADHISVK